MTSFFLLNQLEMIRKLKIIIIQFTLKSSQSQILIFLHNHVYVKCLFKIWSRMKNNHDLKDFFYFKWKKIRIKVYRAWGLGGKFLKENRDSLVFLDPRLVKKQ